MGEGDAELGSDDEDDALEDEDKGVVPRSEMPAGDAPPPPPRLTVPSASMCAMRSWTDAPRTPAPPATRLPSAAPRFPKQSECECESESESE